MVQITSLQLFALSSVVTTESLYSLLNTTCLQHQKQLGEGTEACETIYMDEIDINPFLTLKVRSKMALRKVERTETILLDMDY